MNVKFFGREPALFLALIAVVVQIVSAFWVDVSADEQTWINAAAAAVVGLVVAIVAHDSLSAPILGAIQAVIALAVGFGLDWSAEQQAQLMSLATVLVALFVRQQVAAPEPPPVEKQLFG